METEDQFNNRHIKDDDRHCSNCRFWSYDMDGTFCAHPKSLKETNGFGRALYVFRQEGEPCGVNGKLFKAKRSAILVGKGEKK